jgi:hypothetical protein
MTAEGDSTMSEARNLASASGGAPTLADGNSGLDGLVVLGPWIQGAWCRLAALASWHRGGGDRPAATT